MAIRIPPKTNKDAADSTAALQASQGAVAALNPARDTAVAALTSASTAAEIVAALQTPKA